MIKTIALAFLLFFATTVIAQQQFIQKVKLQNNDTFALNMAEARFAFKENPVRLIWGYPNITYNLKTTWSELLGQSCGNLIEVEVMFQGSKKIMAFNPQFVERVYVDRTTRKTSILLLQSTQIFVCTGSYALVYGLLGSCASSSGAGTVCSPPGYYQRDDSARIAGLRYGRHYVLNAGNPYGGLMGLTQMEHETTWMPEAAADDSIGLGYGQYYVLTADNLYGYAQGTLKIRTDRWATPSIAQCEIFPTEGLPIFVSDEKAVDAGVLPGDFEMLSRGNLYGQPRVAKMVKQISE